MHELFEHTADLGLRATAPDLNELYSEMAECLFSALLDNPNSVRPELTRDFTLAGTDREYLLFDWLRELLVLFDTEKLLFAKFQVEVRTAGISAVASGEPFDPKRHQLSHEIKAITYHELKVEQIPGGWRAEVIVDI